MSRKISSLTLRSNRLKMAGLVMVTMVGCGSDPLEPGAGNDLGSGTSTLTVEGGARATPRSPNASAPEQFDTEFAIRISNAGVAMTTGKVEVTSLGGKVLLTYDSVRDGGRWTGTQASYFEVYEFNIDDGGANNVKGVRIDGPDIHVFTSPTLGASVNATAMVPVAWSRDDQSVSAQMDTKQVEKTAITDTGAYQLPIGALKSKSDKAENETIKLTRMADVTPKGAAAGSLLKVQVTNSVDVLVAATGL
jgi:hypothetical protein